MAAAGFPTMGPNCPCGQGDKVLYWDDVDDWTGISGSATIKSVFRNTIYGGVGATLHDASEFTGDIMDYNLIILPFPIQAASWWAGFLANTTWEGRVLIILEHNDGGFFQPAIDYHNSDLSTLAGISCTGAALDGNPPNAQAFGTIEADDLTDGVEDLPYNLCSKLSGGTVLSYTISPGTDPPGGYSWLAHDFDGRIDWVVMADISNFNNPGGNHVFLQNLWTVDLP